MKRRKTRKIYIGNVPVGGGSPVSVQSMTKTDTKDADSTVRQIKALKRSGCEIIRLAVPDMEAAKTLGEIKSRARIPVVADIHFDWRLALEAISQGVDSLRINPGNIGAKWKVREVVKTLKDRNIPLRVGVNAGSLEKDILKKYGHPTPEALVESAEREMETLDSMGFYDFKVSLKASSVLSTVAAYRLFSKRYDYPLHIGISEAGPGFQGIIKSSVGLGLLLSEGIGDTMRVSLTENPVKEVRAAYEILRSLGMRKRGVEIISCPTCGRCRVDLRGLLRKVEGRLKKIETPLTVAVMGCMVNGPGEAREADIGIAAGKNGGVFFKKGKAMAKADESELLDMLIEEAGKWK